MDFKNKKIRMIGKPKAILYSKNNINYYFKSCFKACNGLKISRTTLNKYLKIGKWKGGTLERINVIPKDYKIINGSINKTNEVIKIAISNIDLIKMLKYYDTYCNNKNSDEEKQQFINKYIKCH